MVCVCEGDNRYFFPLATILGSVRIPLSGNSRKVGELARMGVGAFSGRSPGKGETRPYHTGAGDGPSPQGLNSQRVRG